MSSSEEEITVVRSPSPRQLDEDIDVDILISSIENKPMLWDKTLDSYSDRNEKRKAWKEIFCMLKPGFEHLHQKDQRLIGDSIEKKWKYLKDAYFRTLKENKPKSGDGASKKRKKNYVYHDEMQFLTKTVIPRPTSSSINMQICTEKETEDINSAVSVNESCSQVQIENDLNKKQKKKRNVEDKFIEYLEESTKKSQNVVEKDEHEKFFDSLLSIVRKFDVDQTLAFRAEMITTVQKSKNGGFQNSSVQYQPSQQVYDPSLFYQYYPNNYGIPQTPQRVPSTAASQYSNIDITSASSQN